MLLLRPPTVTWKMFYGPFIHSLLFDVYNQKMWLWFHKCSTKFQCMSDCLWSRSSPFFPKMIVMLLLLWTYYCFNNLSIYHSTHSCNIHSPASHSETTSHYLDVTGYHRSPRLKARTGFCHNLVQSRNRFPPIKYSVWPEAPGFPDSNYCKFAVLLCSRFLK